MNPLKKSIDYFYTHCIDSNFTRHKKQYLFQCFLASGVVFIVLLLLNFVTSTAVISAIGATTFIAFAFPDKKSAQAKYIIRGYFVGIIVGTLAYFLASYHPLFIHSPLVTLEKEILGAFAVGLSMFLMVIFESEHPPASAVALGLVLDEWSLRVVAVTLFAVGLIVFLRWSLRKYLIDLI